MDLWNLLYEKVTYQRIKNLYNYPEFALVVRIINTEYIKSGKNIQEPHYRICDQHPVNSTRNNATFKEWYNNELKNAMINENFNKQIRSAYEIEREMVFLPIT